MSQYEFLSLLLGSIAVGVSSVAYYYSRRAHALSKEANHIAREANKINTKGIETSVKIAHRQGVIDLSKAWEGTSMLSDPIIVPDLVKAVNALSETATAWNHDIIDRLIIIQLYYDSFCRIYEFIEAKREELVPTLSKNFRMLLSSDIQKSYYDMKKLYLSQVVQTKIL